LIEAFAPVHWSLLILVAALSQLLALLLLAALVGNLLSILVPYRMQPGSRKPTKMPGMAMLLMVLCHLLFPVLRVSFVFHSFISFAFFVRTR